MNGGHGCKTAENTDENRLKPARAAFHYGRKHIPMRLICAVTFFTSKQSKRDETIFEAMAHLLRFCFDLSTRPQATP
jgi:hypothetical protein